MTPVILSFDIEEHHRIEAAAGHVCPADLQATYSARMAATTYRLLDQLATHETKATFFIVGEIATTRPKLVRDIHAAGHEVASHSWNHQRVHRFSPAGFADDLRKSKDVLEQVTGAAVHGFRAPTFSVVRQTAWAIHEIANAGFAYDSSIFPVRHDRYGISDAPRTPFIAVSEGSQIMELPPTTLRIGRFNLSVAGGGYFRLFPLALMNAGVRQVSRLHPAAAMLYFHPWEFDPGQPRLPLSRLSGFRTYVGMARSVPRLGRLLKRYHFSRAIDVVRHLEEQDLPRFRVA